MMSCVPPIRDTPAFGTNRTNRAGLTMSVVRGRPEMTFRGRQHRYWPTAVIASRWC